MYLIGTSKFFDGFCLKKRSDQPYYHRWAYKIRLHAKKQFVTLK